MAGTAKSVRTTSLVNEGLSEVTRAELNKVITDLETLRAALDAVCDKLDLDAGVTDTNYAATAAVTTAAAMTAAQITAIG